MHRIHKINRQENGRDYILEAINVIKKDMQKAIQIIREGYPNDPETQNMVLDHIMTALGINYNNI